MVAGAVVGVFIFLDVVMAIDSLPPNGSTFPEGYVGLFGSVTTNVFCLALLFRAQLINNRHAKLRKRGFDVILEQRVQHA
jgi:hypothetical protein